MCTILHTHTHTHTHARARAHTVWLAYVSTSSHTHTHTHFLALFSLSALASAGPAPCCCRSSRQWRLRSQPALLPQPRQPAGAVAISLTHQHHRPSQPPPPLFVVSLRSATPAKPTRIQWCVSVVRVDLYGVTSHDLNLHVLRLSLEEFSWIPWLICSTPSSKHR